MKMIFGFVFGLILILLLVFLNWNNRFSTTIINKPINNIFLGYTFVKKVNRSINNNNYDLRNVLVYINENNFNVEKISYFFLAKQLNKSIWMEIDNNKRIIKTSLIGEGRIPKAKHPEIDLTLPFIPDRKLLDIKEALEISKAKGGIDYLKKENGKDIQINMVLQKVKNDEIWSIYYNSWGKDGPGGSLTVIINALNKRIVRVDKSEPVQIK